MVSTGQSSEVACLQATTRQLRSSIPYLRRFSRALTGRQAIADADVIRVLDEALNDPSLLNLCTSPRASLFRQLLRALGSHASGTGRADGTPFVSPVQRQAHLLIKVEGFTPSEAAEIIGVDRNALPSLLELAARDAASLAGAGVLIIEDDPLISMQLEHIVDQLGHRILGVASTRQQVAKRMRAANVDLVLSDVQLGDGSSGIDAVSDLSRCSNASSIFITAYPERLLTGARPEPTFLISKPFDPEAVSAAISQALYLRLFAADTAEAA